MPIGKIPVPSTHVTDEPLVSICVNNEWIPAILAMVAPAKYPEFWAGTLTENRRARREVQNLLVLISEYGECGGMAKYCCIEPQITRRVDPSTGLLQQSIDGGATWDAASGGFPAYIVEPPPPVTSGVAGTKCDAASNVREQVGEWVSHVIVDFDVALTVTEFGIAAIGSMAAAVLTLIGALPLAGIELLVLPAISAAATAVWTLGKVGFESYWGSDKLDIVLCAAFNHIGEDGAFTDGAFSAFWNECNGLLPNSPAKLLFMGFISNVGRQGLNSMAASGLSADSDCSDCTDSCENDFDVICSIGHDVTKGDGWLQATTDYTGWTGYQSIAISTGDIDKGCFIDHVEVNGVPSSLNSGARWVGEEPWPCSGGIGHVTTNVPCNTIANTWLLWGGSTDTPEVIKVFFSQEACEG